MQTAYKLHIKTQDGRETVIYVNSAEDCTFIRSTIGRFCEVLGAESEINQEEVKIIDKYSVVETLLELFKDLRDQRKLLDLLK